MHVDATVSRTKFTQLLAAIQFGCCGVLTKDHDHSQTDSKTLSGRKVRFVVVLSIYYHLHANLMPHYIKGTSTTGTEHWLWMRGGCVIVQYKWDFFFFC